MPERSGIVVVGFFSPTPFKKRNEIPLVYLWFGGFGTVQVEERGGSETALLKRLDDVSRPSVYIYIYIEKKPQRAF